MAWPKADQAILEDLDRLAEIAEGRREEIEWFRTSGRYEPIRRCLLWEEAIREGIVW